MNIINKMNFWCAFVALFWGITTDVNGSIKIIDGYDPGSCDKSNHGYTVLLQDREDNEKLWICNKDNEAYQWKPVDGFSAPGEFLTPGYDCSDILDKNINTKDGFYWVKFNGTDPKKVWCDMTTDGGGYMLIARKNGSITWSVPSSDDPVEPFGSPHWSSAFGDAPILDFRVQMATNEDFRDTKAHWSFRLQNRRPLQNLMIMGKDGCGPISPGIGDIAYVKDLQTGKIVTTTFRCSIFGAFHDESLKMGWAMMNSCLRKPCRFGFGFHHTYPVKVDNSGAFSYSVSSDLSGVVGNATAFIGCVKGKCCGCFGPIGGTGNYCGPQCTAINGGTTNSRVFTWIWVRSTLPKKIWNKCMEYITTINGHEVWYNIFGNSVVPKKGRCLNNGDLHLNDGIVVVPDATSKVPPISGLLAYRKDNKELYLRANKTWNKIAQEKEISTKFVYLEKRINKFIEMIRNRIRLDVADHPECTGYTWLDDASRNDRFYSGSSNQLCDNHFPSKWYRFGGAAGVRIATKCTTSYMCSALYTGYMVGDSSGRHPEVREGIVSRTVCFHQHGVSCCLWKKTIQVLNCGPYFVYKLSSVGRCNARYCGSFM